MTAPCHKSIHTIDDSDMQALCLLCATASPFWNRHLLNWLPQIACGHPAQADQRESTLHWVSQVTPGSFPASRIDFLRLIEDGPLSLYEELLTNANAIVLCVQGHKFEAYERFLDALDSMQQRLGRTIPLLILTGLIEDDDLGTLNDLCGRHEFAASVYAVSSANDRQILALLSSFLLGLDREDIAPSSTPGLALPQPVLAHADYTNENERTNGMASINESMNELLKIDGAMGVALVDSSSGMVMGKGGGGVNLDAAAAGNTEVVRAKLKTMKALGLEDNIEDMLITLGRQFHIIRPLSKKPGIFIYMVLDKEKANLAMARYKVAEIENNLAF